MLPNPLAMYLALGAAVVGFAGGWTVRDWRCDAAAAAAMAKQAAAKEAADAAVAEEAFAYEDIRADVAEAATIERNTVREIYREFEVPADCAVLPAGRSLLEAARARVDAAAGGEFGAELPVSPANP